eukprot:6556461-Prymnesium_polylepis.1
MAVGHHGALYSNDAGSGDTYFSTKLAFARAMGAVADGCFLYVCFLYEFLVVIYFAVGRSLHYCVGEQSKVTMLWDCELSLSDAVLGSNSQRSARGLRSVELSTNRRLVEVCEAGCDADVPVRAV